MNAVTKSDDRLLRHRRQSADGGVLLVAMPWAYSYMPSIQVGALKAYLNHHGEEAEGAHWFVEIAHVLGLQLYNELWYPHLEDAEALYSYLLFPQLRTSLLHDAHL